jgi:hypothetical protein
MRVGLTESLLSDDLLARTDIALAITAHTHTTLGARLFCSYQPSWVRNQSRR